ncbi:PTS sugar transporter subunit IIA [Lacticaseibacillus suibinensis]|uniref:PTS sugar transporter subunit IIA n=1 Tax=Lacticaseibacillus suibinensis TaxID=2486011 RepID=UPI000F78E958|nr:hypothetical protein [Lacticaseibacillus suibinensis]
MQQIILASHQQLAEGMQKSAEYIGGTLPQLSSMCAYTSPEYNIDQDIEQRLALLHGQKVTVITDIPGGSVNNSWMSYVAEHNLYDQVTIISGMNLALVLEIAMFAGNDAAFERTLPDILKNNQQTIMNCSALLEEANLNDQANQN